MEIVDSGGNHQVIPPEITSCAAVGKNAKPSENDREMTQTEASSRTFPHMFFFASFSCFAAIFFFVAGLLRECDHFFRDRFGQLRESLVNY